MARTFKDKKETKSKRKKLFQPLWTKKFERSHYEGTQNGNEDLDLCPVCRTPTDFQWGFISCSKCDWGNHLPESKDSLKEEDFEFKSAA